MTAFKRQGGFGGNRGFGRGPKFGGDRQMHPAICSSCGKDCRVPFKPSGAKPVFCSDCFEKNNAGDNSRPRRFERGSGNDSGQNQQQFDALNAKLDKILSLLQPAPVKSAPNKPKAKPAKVAKAAAPEPANPAI